MKAEQLFGSSNILGFTTTKCEFILNVFGGILFLQLALLLKSILTTLITESVKVKAIKTKTLLYIIL